MPSGARPGPSGDLGTGGVARAWHPGRRHRVPGGPEADYRADPVDERHHGPPRAWRTGDRDRWEGRRDEIGEMIAAVIVFRNGMVESARLAAERAAERRHAATDKQAALIDMAEKIENEVGAGDGCGWRTHGRDGGDRGADERFGRPNRGSAQGAAGAAAEVLANAQTVASAAEQLAASIREIGAQVGQSTIVASRAAAVGGETRVTMQALTCRPGGSATSPT